MADIEDLLGEDEHEPQDKRDTAFAQMRKELTALKKEAEELRTFRAEAEKDQRTATVSEAFKALGLKPKHAEFYPADAPAEPEAIKAWAVDKELVVLEDGDEEPETPAPTPTSGFTPTSIGESAPLGSRRYSFEEWDGLLRSDPEKAMKAWNSGRVQKETSPGGTVFVGRDR